MRRWLYVLILALLTAMPSLSEAACSGSSPTLTAASASRADVDACVTAAVSGDTINVPAGAATWTSSITISTKDLTMHGSGNGSNPAVDTIITGTAAPGPDSFPNCFSIGSGNVSSSSRVTNFRFIDCTLLTYGLNGTKTFRVDHNYFQGATNRYFQVAGYTDLLQPRGLFDHNTLERVRFVIIGTLAILADGIYEHKLWATAPDFGGPTGVYIEDNTIIGGPTATDCTKGSLTVFRFNTVTTDATYVNEMHGVQQADLGCQAWEIYGNTFTNVGTPSFTNAYMRGGTGVFFSNTSANFGGLFGGDGGPALKVERSLEDKSPFGICDGALTPSTIVDGSLGGGYPCRDQIGRKQDVSLYAGNYPYSGTVHFPAQLLSPVYGWRNIQAGVLLPMFSFSTSATHLVENRDFYNGVSVNAQSSASTPFNGTVGTGYGTLANRPTTCTTGTESGGGVAYWATDQGSWNTSTTNPQGVQFNGEDGVLYRCSATNTWTVHYTPYSYPHPLQGAPTPPAPDAVATSYVAAFRGPTFAAIIWSRSTDANHKAYNIYRCPTSAACLNLVKTITPASAAAAHSPETQWIDTSLYVAGQNCYSVSDVNTSDYVGPATTPSCLTVTGKQ